MDASLEPQPSERRADGRYINLNWRDRFVSTRVLRDAYVHYPPSRNPTAIPYVPLPDSDMELGIVSSAVPEMARALSSMMSCSIDDARNDIGGHLPVAVVRRLQREIVSPYGVAHLWGATGHRFVLSRPVDAETRELVATILVGQSKDTVFFFTGRYNNLRHSTIAETVDLDQPAGERADQRWFDCFAFPPLERFKPKAYHHIANFVVAKGHRGQGLSRYLLRAIKQFYARDHIDARGAEVIHSQHLLCGRGFWQIGDPPWLERMERLGFYLRWGAESFFIEHDWAPLPPILDAQGEPIANVPYTASYGLPKRYHETQPEADCDEHLLDRVEEVIALSQNPNAKLQYFQTMFDFV